jgi:hypothetical protein
MLYSFISRRYLIRSKNWSIISLSEIVMVSSKIMFILKIIPK